MVTIWYASMEDVKRAADISSSAGKDAEVMQALDESSDAVEKLCRRVFYPTVATRQFPWPQDWTQNARILELGKNELISVSSVVNGDGQTVAPSSISLHPADTGPPYSTVLNTDAFLAATAFPLAMGASITVSGTYGHKINEQSVATTTTNLSGTTVTVNNSSKLGIGSLIRIGNERLVITAKGWTDSLNAVPITLTNLSSDDTFTVTSGASYFIGEMLLIESERMIIRDIVGNKLIVKRAVDGTVLNAHTTITLVNVARLLTVERAVLGTTAIDTPSPTAVQLFVFPPLVRRLARAEALNALQQDSASYAHMAGSTSDRATPMNIHALDELRIRVQLAHGRFLTG